MTSETQAERFRTMNGRATTGPTYSRTLSNALEQEMIPNSTLPAARHFVENLLAAIARSISINDREGLSSLLHGVQITIDHDEPTSGPGTASLLLDVFRDVRPISCMTIGNLSFSLAGPDITYAGSYQLWGASAPYICVEIGVVDGKLEAGPQVWYWKELNIIRSTQP
ncbi:hypothetical protein [Arthrobacter sp. RAF14]|uniref:hypothetical protein n=1 Tax=Arthrobacter sp. RAF14 TaxID=3233051 RepID=UPI003F8E6D13